MSLQKMFLQINNNVIIMKQINIYIYISYKNSNLLGF